jgi:hypothetical protein
MKTSTKLTLALGLAVVLVMVMVQGGSWLRPTATASAAYSDPVGFVKIEMNINDFTMVAIPLAIDDMGMNDSDDSAICAGEMLADGLIGSLSLGTSDQLFFWNGTGFDIYYLFDGSGYPAYDGKWFDLDTGLPEPTREFQLFEGYFVKRINSGPSVAQSTVLGDVQISDTITISIPEGFNMIAYPYPVDVDINSSDFCRVGDGAKGSLSLGTSDQLYFWNGTGFDIYYLFDGSGYPAYDDKWFDLDTGLPAVGKVVGTFDAFYYKRLSGEGTLTWDVERPFSVD